MPRDSQIWEVHLLVDGATKVEEVRVNPPFGIAGADAEVKAIKAAQADGAKDVRCTFSRFLREAPPITCAFCGKTAEGDHAINRDGFMVGPEVDLCNACGSEETPTCEEIWERIAQPADNVFAYRREPCPVVELKPEAP